MVGLGTWTLQGDVLINALENAYEVGYRHIDTAKHYENEQDIGLFLKKHKREEFFITTKLWNSDQDSVLEAINGSLERLGTDYVDLYLIHWPVNFNGPFNLKNVWTEMEKLVDLGKAKSIGVSNFGLKNLKSLLSFCRIKPVINQIELHPYLPQTEIRDFCQENGIEITSYSSFGSSFDDGPDMTNDPVLKEIAEQYNCSTRSIILNFLLSEGIIVIPRSKSKDHLKANMNIINLKPEEIDKIKSIKIRHRYIDPEKFGDHRFD